MTDSDLIFYLLRAALHDERPQPLECEIETTRWWRVFRLMQQNHVAALCCEAAAAAGMPREVKMPWLAEREKAVAWHKHQASVQAEITETMARHGIETLVLKGTHMARYYPHPELREFGDIDLYFYDQHAEADRVAKSELGVALSNDGHHHTKYDYRGVTVESHYDFVNRHYPRSNRSYERVLKELAPTATFELLFLLRHMAVHFASSRITLRDLCDWAMSWQRLRHDADPVAIGDAIDAYGMGTFAACIDTIANRRLGIGAEHDDIEAATLRRVENDIIYGSREAADHKAENVGRLLWKIRRWRAMEWKRRLAFADSDTSMTMSSIGAHLTKPHTILHKT